MLVLLLNCYCYMLLLLSQSQAQVLRLAPKGPNEMGDQMHLVNKKMVTMGESIVKYFQKET